LGKGRKNLIKDKKKVLNISRENKVIVVGYRG
jgi:hypothetical protein